GQVPRVARLAHGRQVPAQSAARPDHRERSHLGRGPARGPAERRRLRREERRPGQSHRRHRVRRVVTHSSAPLIPPKGGKIARRAGGFTYLTVLFIVAIMGIGLALAGTVWQTAALREREAE